MASHRDLTLGLVDRWEDVKDGEVTVKGTELSIAEVYAVAHQATTKVAIDTDAPERLEKNVQFLREQLARGTIVYGVNTGYGGSADVRSADVAEIQRSLVRHLNAGFGDVLPASVSRAVMLVRCNSLCRGYSGVRPAIVELIKDMLNHDLVPVMPKRGSVSASGDLMPISYLATCMNGRPDAKVIYKGQEMLAPEAMKEANLSPIDFQEKEALAVVNAGSCASSLAACVLFEANIAVLLTQAATAMTIEAMCGRIESFHPTLHRLMAFPGQQEVAENVRNMLKGSQLVTRSTEHQAGNDQAGTLKQDRYALRSSPQWLGPVLETLKESVRRIHTEINSVNDNPIIDHENGEVLHGANFQAISVTVAMDQARQAVQLCGKLLFGQMQELTNVALSGGLPPNLAASNTNTDFGFKGMDTAMASYMSELDYLCNTMTNHVLSAELHNQSVNSMGLVSARLSEQAVELIQMMLANILCAHLQAVDLRWLRIQVERELATIQTELHFSDQQIHPKLWPWYNFAFQPRETTEKLLDSITTNGTPKDVVITRMEEGMKKVMQRVQNMQHIDEVEQMLGKGTSQLYRYLRKDLAVPFNTGIQYPDTSLQIIYDAIKTHKIVPVLKEVFKSQ